MTGVVRRHTFTQWELEFLLDLQTSRIRKAQRNTVLRKYLQVVQQSRTDGAPEPPRLCMFIATEYPARTAATAG